MFEIRSIMITDIVYTRTDTPIYDAVEMLVEHNVTGLPVVNNDMTLAGVLTEKDVLRLMFDSKDDSATVQDFMTENVVTFDVDDDFIAVCEYLINDGPRRVLILTNGRLAGLISRRDLIKYILEPIEVIAT